MEALKSFRAFIQNLPLKHLKFCQSTPFLIYRVLLVSLTTHYCVRFSCWVVCVCEQWRRHTRWVVRGEAEREDPRQKVKRLASSIKLPEVIGNTKGGGGGNSARNTLPTGARKSSRDKLRKFPKNRKGKKGKNIYPSRKLLKINYYFRYPSI